MKTFLKLRIPFYFGLFFCFLIAVFDPWPSLSLLGCLVFVCSTSFPSSSHVFVVSNSAPTAQVALQKHTLPQRRKNIAGTS